MSDPRSTLLQTLIDCVRENKPQHPLAQSEISTALYSDERWFEHEQKSIFADVPIIVGFSSMIKDAGQFITFDHLGKPLLIVRGKDGLLRCFLNVCRHRGVRLSNARDVSHTRTFSCPYHHWTYDLEGKLIFVPAEEGFPNLDKNCRSLTQLPIQEAHGFIWVKTNKDSTIDLSQFLGSIAEDFDLFQIAGSHYFKSTSKVYNSNWKIIIEAFQDSYHVTRLHAKTVGDFFMDNASVQDRINQHLRSAVARKEIVEAMDIPSDQWNYRFHASYSYFIWPNNIIIMHPDYTSQIGLYPLDTDRTMVLHNCVIQRKPQSEKELAHFERSFKLIDEGVLASEDFYISEQAQIGIRSGANETFLVGGYESGILAFHQILEESTGPYFN